MIPSDAVFIIVLLMIAKNNYVSAFSQPSPSSSSDWLPNLQQEVTAAQQQPPPPPPPPLQSQSVSSSFNKQPPPLPNTENSYTLLGLNQDEKDLTIVQRSYRQLAKLYHPDVCVGPDATIEERERANKDFVRINEAYDNIKSRGGEEEIEVVIMGGNFSQGKRDRRVRYKTSEKIRQANPNRIDYDRILDLRQRSNLKGTNWSDPGEYDYQQGGRHNGDFGPPRRWN